MIIEFHDVVQAEDEMLMAATKVALRHRHVQRADIYVSPRTPSDAPAWQHPGWIEYIVRLNYENGGGMTVGVLQRDRNSPIECHS